MDSPPITQYTDSRQPTADSLLLVPTADHLLLAPSPAPQPDSRVLATQPPYALASTPFRFAALAALAGRAPLGGRREVALAVYLGARLAHDALPDRALPVPSRAERAGHARTWLSTVALPAAVRPSLTSLVDASAGERAGIVNALRAVIAASDELLDAAALTELAQLVSVLEAP